jgi:thymidylate synthase
MRIYQNIKEAVREVERDLWEMGIITRPSSMQNKVATDPEEFTTKELRAYGFQISGSRDIVTQFQITSLVAYLIGEEQVNEVYNYITEEFHDRFYRNRPLNPGNSSKHRQSVWNDFCDEEGKFHYTYSERIVPQLKPVLRRLRDNADSRQCIISIFNGLSVPSAPVYRNGGDGLDIQLSQDQNLAGGVGRIPCSMYYQLLSREGAVDLIYTMRSCDLLTHFLVDILLAMMFQDLVASELDLKIGTFTYFTGSLHAYRRDLKDRNVF